jgi:DNA-binding response OmpR family regulator
LIVEDEPSLRSTVAYNLKRSGYEVVAVGDGEAGLREAATGEFDLIILDVMLPTIDGFEVCRQIRRQSSVPILILTARDDEIDRVVGLEIGADDYLTKPFSMRELVARVKALLRRRTLLQEELASEHAADDAVIVVGDLRIDLNAYRATMRSRELARKPKEFELLVYLVRHRGTVCSTRQLLGEVWGYDYFGDSRTLAVHIHGLREKLEAEPGSPRLIETVRGVGYRFSA